MSKLMKFWYLSHIQPGPTQSKLYNHIPTEKKISGIPLEFWWKSTGIKGTFFHWIKVISLEFPLDSSGNSTGSVEIPLDSVEIQHDSSGIPLDSSGIPLESSGNSI